MKLDLGQVVTVDFETYFDKEYSLRVKELNTSDYVRDSRFLAHCVSIKQGETPTRVYWYTDIDPALRRIDWENVDLLCHNTAFDGFILSQCYGIKPRRYLDTMSMGQALHGNVSRVSLEALCALYGMEGKNPNILAKMKGHREIPEEIRVEAETYCIGDTDKCWTIFKRMIEVYPADEIALIDWTVRQFCDPVLLVDVARAKAELEREQQHKQELIAKTGLDEDQLQSAAKFAAQLQALGIEPPMKISARTKLPTFAFSQQDEEFMDLVTHEDEKVRDLIRARLAAKSTIGETRAQRFVDIGENTLPVGYRYAAAHTLRWGGTNKCLSGDSVITVKRKGGVCDILLNRLSLTDLVWDGEEFVEHAGLLDQGLREVITYGGITSTPDHIVFCGKEETPVPLGTAKSKELSLTPRVPPRDLGTIKEDLPDSQRPMQKSLQENEQPVVARVYDIANCGPRNRFVANGKLVSNCNLQNLEKEERDDNNVPVPNTGELRKSIIAPPGHQLVVADSAQIEARVLAWLAGQEDRLELFRSGADPYCTMGPMIYGREITRADRDERALLKAAELGLGFYMGAKRYQATLAMGILGPKTDKPLDFCELVVRTWRKKNHMIAALWRDMDSILYRMLMKKAYGKPYEGTEYKILEYDSETIWLPNGMGLHYPDLRAEWNSRKDRFEDYTYRQNKTFEYIHCGLLTENVVQALARMIIAEQLLRINAKYRVLLTTHDELVCLARDEEAAECLRFMIEQMSIPPAWAPDLPLGAEGGYARNYSK